MVELRRALAAIGYPQEDYAGHSFRIGAATTAAAAAGLEDSTIQLLGRWNSAAFLSYIRTPASHAVSGINGQSCKVGYQNDFCLSMYMLAWLVSHEAAKFVIL